MWLLNCQGSEFGGRAMVGKVQRCSFMSWSCLIFSDHLVLSWLSSLEFKTFVVICFTVISLHIWCTQGIENCMVFLCICLPFEELTMRVEGSLLGSLWSRGATCRWSVENFDFLTVAGASLWLSLLPRKVWDLVGTGCTPWEWSENDVRAWEWAAVMSPWSLGRSERGLPQVQKCILGKCILLHVQDSGLSPVCE